MAGLVRRENRTTEAKDVFSRLDQLFDEWTSQFPARASEFFETATRRSPFPGSWGRTDVIRVDEYREGDDLVIRAELPGIDPDEDVTVTVRDHTLHIEAHRREETETTEKGFTRREMRYGHFTRQLPLPESVTEEDISASYTDGILEIRAKAPRGESTTIPVERR